MLNIPFRIQKYIYLYFENHEGEKLWNDISKIHIAFPGLKKMVLCRKSNNYSDTSWRFLNKYISTEFLSTGKYIQDVYEIQYFKKPLILRFFSKPIIQKYYYYLRRMLIHHTVKIVVFFWHHITHYIDHIQKL